MSCSSGMKKYKGVRQRKWGKWVSEIRVPGSRERLWLGTYATPEAAAVAHDVAFYCLRRPLSLDKLNLPDMLPSDCVRRLPPQMSPRSVQAAASEAGMAVDAQSIIEAEGTNNNDHIGEELDQVMHSDHGSWWDGVGDTNNNRSEGEEALNISIDDYFLDIQD